MIDRKKIRTLLFGNSYFIEPDGDTWRVYIRCPGCDGTGRIKIGESIPLEGCLGCLEDGFFAVHCKTFKEVMDYLAEQGIIDRTWRPETDEMDPEDAYELAHV